MYCSEKSSVCIWVVVSQARLYIPPRGEVKSGNLPIPFWFTEFKVIACHVNGMLTCFMPSCSKL